MPLTKAFKTTIQEALTHDPDYRRALLQEAIECFLNGEDEDGKGLLRNFINGTCGFATLAKALGKPDKSLMRMFSANGNPTLTNLVRIFTFLRQQEGFDSVKVEFAKVG